MAVFTLCSAAEYQGDSLKAFGGIEEPNVVFRVATKSLVEDVEFVNITDRGNGTFRMTLRYRAGEWWDGDRETKSTDRQRAEIKVLGPRQGLGETFEYRSTWRLDPEFKVGSRFCHVTQVKGYGGPDTGAPLVTTSLHDGGKAGVRYCSAGMEGLTAVRSFEWAPDKLRTIAYRLTISSANNAPDGALIVSIDGDAFAGITKTPMYRRDATQYQPKWGLYRGVNATMPFGDNYVEHSDVRAVKLAQ